VFQLTPQFVRVRVRQAINAKMNSEIFDQSSPSLSAAFFARSSRIVPRRATALLMVDGIHHQRESLLKQIHDLRV